MSETLRPLESYPFHPSLPSSPHKLSPGDSDHDVSFTHAQVQSSLPSDFQFDPSALAGSPEHPQNHDMTASWTAVESHSFPNAGYGSSHSLSMAGSTHPSPTERPMEPMDVTHSYVAPSFTPMMGYPQASIHPHVLSHASSSSSLASLSSHHDSDAGRLLVQTFPTDHSMDLSPAIMAMPHSRHSSFSSLTMPYDEKMFNNPLPVGMGMMDANMYPLPALHESVTAPQSISTGQVFMNAQRTQQPRLAVQTQGLGKVNRERSASRSTPYTRYRSESISAKSEEGDEIASMMSASTNYSSQAPWSAATTNNGLSGNLNRMTLHHRRTSSNMPSTPFQSPVSRPMLSRARRSTSFILSKPQSQQELRANSTEVRLSGSAAERQETVRQDLTEKAEEIKSLNSTSQQDKARALWVRRWLVLSYTHAPGRTVPRQGLYHSYTVSCEEYGLKPINSASFGKAVRSAYPGIKTRRLGVRGNSKYHYVSIRPAIQIEAERLNEFGDSSGAWHVAPEDGSMDFRATTQVVDEEMDGDEMDESEDEEEPFSTDTLKRSPSSYDFRTVSSASRSRATSINDAFPSRPRFARRHTTAALSGTFNPASLALDVPSQSQAQVAIFNLPGFPTLANIADLSNELPVDEVSSFWNAFCHHQEMLAGCMRGLHFDRFEVNCRTFWASCSPVARQICTHPVVSRMISDATAISYDRMVGILFDRLNTSIPVSTQTSLRGLVENLETIMEECLATFPREFSEAKIELSVRAAHLFVRFLDLHQLSAALAPILSSSTHTRDMVVAWETLDIRNVADQCALSCSCQQDILEQVLADFGNWLNEIEGAATSARGTSARGVERLGQWVDRMIEDVTVGVPGVRLRAITCRVAFITSQVMRDFTLKSDKSFGLFQLIKTWIDDYVSIYSLRQTALSTSSVEAAGTNASSAQGHGHGGHYSSGSGSSISSMSVFIPPPSTNMREDTDLSTAVPFAPGSTGTLQPNLGGFECGDGAQYVPVPSFEGGMDSIVTPRPGIFAINSKDNVTYGYHDTEQQQ